jgi:hypothetical protein
VKLHSVLQFDDLVVANLTIRAVSWRHFEEQLASSSDASELLDLSAVSSFGALKGLSLMKICTPGLCSCATALVPCS